jgi:hypothetical protein
MLNEIENQFLVDGGCKNAICLIVEYQGNQIYKFMLVNQLNANPFLSMDRLTCVRKSMYFNNLDVYSTTTSSSSTCLLSLGNNCGVYFVQDNNNQASSKQQGGKNSRVGKPIHICNDTSNGTWWLGKMQRIRKRVRNRRGLSRQPIDLMNKPNVVPKKIIEGLVIMVLLNWFSKSCGNFKCMYDVIDTNWVDATSIISTIIMNYEKEKNIYWLDCINANFLDEFVTNKVFVKCNFFHFNYIPCFHFCFNLQTF